MTYQLQLSDEPYPFETGVIYKLTAPNGNAYVGQTLEYEIRMMKHKNAGGNCRKLNASIKKYGFDNFKKEILADDLQPGLELDSAEIYYIAYHNTFNSPHGLNLKAGGGGGRLSEETKQRLRKPKSEAAKANMRGPKSLQTCANISKGKKGKCTGDDNPMKRWENKVNCYLSMQLHRHERGLEAEGLLC